MPDYIRSNKLKNFRLLQGIGDAVQKHDHKAVEILREQLSLLARLENAGDD